MSHTTRSSAGGHDAASGATCWEKNCTTEHRGTESEQQGKRDHPLPTCNFAVPYHIQLVAAAAAAAMAGAAAAAFAGHTVAPAAEATADAAGTGHALVAAVAATGTAAAASAATAAPAAAGTAAAKPIFPWRDRGTK